MKLARWTPSREVLDLRSEMDRFLNAWMRDFIPTEFEGRSWTPAADVKETEDGFQIRIDLPGVDKKDVKVSVFGDSVTVRGERKEETEEKGKNGSWHRVERFHGLFERTFNLGTDLEPNKVKAKYKDGVLEIYVPKAETAKPREIEVEVGG